MSNIDNNVKYFNIQCSWRWILLLLSCSQLSRSVRKKQLSLLATGIQRHVESRSTEKINAFGSYREQQDEGGGTSSHQAVSSHVSYTSDSTSRSMAPTTVASQLVSIFVIIIYFLVSINNNREISKHQYSKQWQS